MRAKIALRLLLLSVIIVSMGCSLKKEHLMTGRTMGTIYHIKVIAGRFENMAAVQAQVDELLDRINQSMSTYLRDSEISRWNAWEKTDTPFVVSEHFLRVMNVAREVYKLSGGAWDGTVYPLVNLWGFGKDGPVQKIPSEEDVARVRENVGFNHIEIAAGHLMKKVPRVKLDLASIAKGYGVDQVGLLLKELDYHDFLVEIGGEVYASGKRLNGVPWRVGINQPRAGAPADTVYKVVDLQEQALATSGDYRNFFQIDGRTFSHIIDPRTGYPTQNKVISASVQADNCTLADGLATALMVMGPNKGIDLLNQMEGVEGFVVAQQPDGRQVNFSSRGWVDLDP